MTANSDAPIATSERFAEVVEQFRPLLAKTAIQAGWRQSKNLPSDVVEDLIQTAILRVWKRGKWAAMTQGALLAYLKTTVKRTTLNHLRGERRGSTARGKIHHQQVAASTRGAHVQAQRPFREDSVLTVETKGHHKSKTANQGFSPLKDHHAIPANDHENELATKMTVAKVLGKLPSEPAEIVRLVYWEGHELKEVAKELGIRLRTVERRLSDARTALRSLLSD